MKERMQVLNIKWNSIENQNKKLVKKEDFFAPNFVSKKKKT